MTGVFIYLKIDGYVTGWYNVVGYVGDPEPNTTSFLVDRPVIKYNNEYMELLWEPGKGITDLGVITENLLLITSQEKYFTIIKDSSEDNIIGTIVNDLPILYDISIRGIADENNKFTFYTYNVTLDKITLNAVRKDSPVILQYGPSVTVNKDNVDFDVEHNTYGCEFVPEVGSELISFPPINGLDTTHTAIIFQFSTPVSKGSNFSDLSRNPIIILDSAHNQKMAAEQVTFDLDDNGNYTNTGKILFKNTVYTVTEDGEEITKNSGLLVDDGVYTLYIPNAIFKVANDNVDYIVAKFTVNSGKTEDPFLYSVTPSFTEKLETITIMSNLEFLSCTYDLTTLNGSIVISLSTINTLKTDRTVVRIPVSPAILASEDTKYRITFRLTGSSSMSIHDGYIEEIITVKAPLVQYLSRYIISGPTKIRRVGNYTYTVTPYPARAIDADYTLSIKEENSKATLEGNVLSIATLDDGEEYDVTLVATLTASPNKTEEFKIKVAYIDDLEIVDLTGLSIKGTDLIYAPGIYSYNVLVNPENATFSSYYWESNSSYFTTSSGVIRVDTLPSEELTVTIKAISDLDSSIYDIKKITIASSYVPLLDIEILGPKEITVGDSAVYTILNNPSNATSWYSRWGNIKMSDGSSLKSGYNFDSTSGTLSVSSDAEEGIVTLAATNTDENLRTTFNVTIVPKRIPTSDHSIKNITVSGLTSINSVGNYNYKAILDPSDTEDTLVSWSLIDCYYSGISINKLGILLVTRMPVNNAIIKIGCKSVTKPNIEAVQEVTLIAASFEEDIEPSNEFVFSFYPEAGAVTQLKDIRISISNSSSVTRLLPVTEITLDGPVSDKHLSGEMDLRAVNGQALKLSLTNTYTSFGTYRITFPEGFFNIDGEESPTTTVTYTIKDTSSDTSDDESDTFGGLLTYGSNINRFRIKGSDTVVVAEVGGSIPTIYLNPQVYYINKSGNYAIVTDGEVNLRIKYRTLEGILTLEFSNIPYNKGYNLTSNIFNKIPNLRDAEITVTINFNYLSVSKHFKLAFVDLFNYTKIRNNSSFSLLVNDVTEEFELTTAVYGCTRITGYEVVQTITKRDESGNGTIYKLCDDRTINKLRLGNLTNIYDERFGLKLPHGYGLYSENVFLTGSFVLNNGRSLIDIDKEITLINGNVERALQLLNDTKTELQNQYKDTIKDLANTLELMHQIGSKSVARLDDIGSDGVISVDEKAAVLQEWLSCISEFNRILKAVFDYKEKLADDKVYKDLQLANRDLVWAFYDLNLLTTGLILKDITVNTYDSNPDPAFTLLSINLYINDSERIINFVDKKDINWKSEDEETPEETPEETEEIEENPTETPEESTEVEEGLKIYNYSLENTDLLYYNPEKYLKYNPIYLYPTYLEEGKVKEEAANTTFIEGLTIKENERLKLNFFYESKDDKNFTYSWIIRKYREVYEKVLLLLSKASATESIVELFNTEGEKAADAAIRNFMGNFLDTVIHTGADFSIFAMGSAGIAITNPDLTYTIGGSSLSDFILDELDKLNTDSTYLKLLLEGNKLKQDIETLGKYDDLTPENKVKWDLLNDQLLEIDEKITPIKKRAITLGMVNYNKTLENSDPSLVEPNMTTVGDGDEQLYLFGDKVKVLTTDYITGEDDENVGTKIKYYKVSFKNENNTVLERYIKQYDLKYLRGNYLDRQLSLLTTPKLVTEDSSKGEASTKARVIGSGLSYYNLNNEVLVKEGVMPADTLVTILYKLAALFLDGFLNTELLKTGNLEIGSYDENMNLITNDLTKPFVRAYKDDRNIKEFKYKADGTVEEVDSILPGGVLQALGAKLQGELTVGTKTGESIFLGRRRGVNTENESLGLYLINSDGLAVGEFSTRTLSNHRAIYNTQANDTHELHFDEFTITGEFSYLGGNFDDTYRRNSISNYGGTISSNPTIINKTDTYTGEEGTSDRRLVSTEYLEYSIVKDNSYYGTYVYYRDLLPLTQFALELCRALNMGYFYKEKMVNKFFFNFDYESKYEYGFTRILKLLTVNTPKSGTKVELKFAFNRNSNSSNTTVQFYYIVLPTELPYWLLNTNLPYNVHTVEDYLIYGKNASLKPIYDNYVSIEFTTLVEGNSYVYIVGGMINNFSQTTVAPIVYYEGWDESYVNALVYKSDTDTYVYRTTRTTTKRPVYWTRELWLLAGVGEANVDNYLSYPVDWEILSTSEYPNFKNYIKNDTWSSGAIVTFNVDALEISFSNVQTLTNIYHNGIMIGANLSNYFAAYTDPNNLAFNLDFLAAGYGMHFDRFNQSTSLNGYTFPILVPIYKAYIYLQNGDPRTYKIGAELKPKKLSDGTFATSPIITREDYGKISISFGNDWTKITGHEDLNMSNTHVIINCRAGYHNDRFEIAGNGNSTLKTSIKSFSNGVLKIEFADDDSRNDANFDIMIFHLTSY